MSSSASIPQFGLGSKTTTSSFTPIIGTATTTPSSGICSVFLVLDYTWDVYSSLGILFSMTV